MAKLQEGLLVFYTGFGNNTLRGRVGLVNRFSESENTFRIDWGETVSWHSTTEWLVDVHPHPDSAPQKLWKHGYCVGCHCELAPALDGEGSLCGKCTRRYNR